MDQYAKTGGPDGSPVLFCIVPVTASSVLPVVQA